VFRAIFSAVRFWWKASAGHRLRPWQSPYLRWRVETYTGKPAGTLRLADFLRLAFTERHQLGRFFVWTSDLNAQAEGRRA
jgi:hypothetical protein